MGNQITIIKEVRVPGGIEVQAIARSDRGTKYIVKSVVVLRGDKTPAEWKSALGKAVQEVTGQPVLI